MRISIDVGVKHTDIEKIHELEQILDDAMVNKNMIRFDTTFHDYLTVFTYDYFPNAKEIQDGKNT